ncbi:MAG TPA: GtrA family protein [Verrucomicrobiae bacterium]|nr:GtrA family protein [Verrucomicrobiae bacterium]
MNPTGLLQRVLKFNAVGAIGIVVQTAALWLFWSALRIQYLAADAMAVEIAVLHNFAWHEHWTWRDRTASHRGWPGRLVRFNLSNGLISIAVNVGAMRIMAGTLHWPKLLANFVGIAAGAAANYLASDRFVFSSTGGRASARSRH